jgi:hypothetical protein
MNKKLKLKKTAKSTKAATHKKPAKARKLKIKIPRTQKQYSAMSEEAQDKWNRIAHVVAKMRSEGVSLSKAAKEFAVDSRNVVDLAKAALRKQNNGRYVAKKADKLLRVLVVPSPDGLKEVVVRDSETASKIAQYSDAVQKYLRTGDTARLTKFKRLKLKDANGKRISLLVDVVELNRLGSAGVLTFESLYARAA